MVHPASHPFGARRYFPRINDVLARIWFASAKIRNMWSSYYSVITWRVIRCSLLEFNIFDSPYVCAIHAFKTLNWLKGKLSLNFLTHSVGFPFRFVLFLSRFLRFLYLQAHTCNTLTFWRLNYFFLNFSTPVYKMWIIQEPNALELWNKLHFEEEKNGEYIPCLKYCVPIFVE